MEDIEFVRGVRLMARNPDLALDLYDESVRVAVNSRDAEYVKRAIRDKIARASITVCFISGSTNGSEWVNWELEESSRQGNHIILMAIKGVDRAILPRVVRESGLKFHPWSYEVLQRLIGQT